MNAFGKLPKRGKVRTIIITIMTDKQKIIIGIMLGVVALGLLIFYFGRRPAIETQNFSLTIWGTEDSRSVWDGMAGLYQQKYPKVQITYKAFAPDVYESELVNALATGNGPDVFMMHNDWLMKHYKKAVPASSEVMTAGTFESIFPQVASEDFVMTDSSGAKYIYALPLSIDTLALLYNKDMFDNARIATPPTTWDELKTDVLKLRAKSGTKITRAGIALGGTNASIAHATDLLTELMRQYGAKMVADDYSSATFAAPEGEAALKFYAQFADPNSKYYTWNDKMGDAIAAFATGQTAMIFGTTEDIAQVMDRNAYFNLGIQFMPQMMPSAVNVADYWGLAVSAKSAQRAQAWDFVKFATTDTSAARQYSLWTGKAPALRTLIGEEIADPKLGVFAAQALTARSYKVPEPAKTEKSLNDAISAVMGGSLSVSRALQKAEDEISMLMQSATR